MLQWIDYLKFSLIIVFLYNNNQHAGLCCSMFGRPTVSYSTDRSQNRRYIINNISYCID